MFHEVVVVGAGPAGAAAAVQLARLGYRPLLVDALGVPGGLLPNARRIENYPGFEQGIRGVDMVAHLERMLSRWNLSVAKDRLEAVLETEDGLLLRFQGQEVCARRAILATGTAPDHLPQLTGVTTRWFSTVTDCIRHRPAQVLIIGGGEASFDYALTLADRGTPVTLAYRSDTPRATGVLVEEARSRAGICLMPGAQLIGVSPDGIPAVRVGGHRQEFPGTALLVAVGRHSTLSDFSLSGDGSPFTNLPSLFIAGDMRIGGLGQLGCAVGDGLHAASLVARSL